MSVTRAGSAVFVQATILQPGAFSFISRVASSPSVSGISISRSTRSGRMDRISSTASALDEAPPAKVKSGLSSRMLLTSERGRDAPSTTTTRIVSVFLTWVSPARSGRFSLEGGSAEWGACFNGPACLKRHPRISAVHEPPREESRGCSPDFDLRASRVFHPKLTKSSASSGCATPKMTRRR